MYEILSSIMKYIFITIIYLFIYGIIRLIYLDISSMGAKGKHGMKKGKNLPYIKLINRREDLGFKVEETYTLDGNMELGRSNKNDIVIKDPYVSGKHVRFTVHDGRTSMQDLNSTNGSFVNGERLGRNPVYLRDGDKIHIGQMDFLYVEN